MPNQYDVFAQYQWHRAYPHSQVSGILKQQPSDFQVIEEPLTQASGEGEHLWLEVEKTNCNSGWVAEQLAAYFKVKPKDVGFAGRKDRHAKTQQMMSVYLPHAPHATISSTPFAGVRILSQKRHHKKIRKGELLGNHFRLHIRELIGSQEKLQDNLTRIQQGVPNYFGSQRFGHFAHNIHQARNMLDSKQSQSLAHKKPQRIKNQDLYLSALRSFLFNELLSTRIQQQTWHSLLEGEPQAQPTGALWGRGQPLSQSKTRELEQALAHTHPKDCMRLEHSGLNQQRRVLIAKVQELDYQLRDNHLTLSFYLSAGQYATCVLRELLDVQLCPPSKERTP